MERFKVRMTATATVEIEVAALCERDARILAQDLDPEPGEVGDWDVDGVERVD